MTMTRVHDVCVLLSRKNRKCIQSPQLRFRELERPELKAISAKGKDSDVVFGAGDRMRVHAKVYHIYR